jgi:hypothetical protein
LFYHSGSLPSKHYIAKGRDDCTLSLVETRIDIEIRR